MVATPMGDGDAEVEDDDGEVDGKSATGEMEGGDGGATGEVEAMATLRWRSATVEMEDGDGDGGGDDEVENDAGKRAGCGGGD